MRKFVAVNFWWVQNTSYDLEFYQKKHDDSEYVRRIVRIIDVVTEICNMNPTKVTNINKEAMFRQSHKQIFTNEKAL